MEIQFPPQFEETNPESPAKHQEDQLKMVAGAFYLPKYNPHKPEGEDAHFICSEQQTLGLADGVGGWIKKGVDAGEYARDLMNNAAIAVHCQPKGSVDPKIVLNEAFLNTSAEGSSTACISTLKDHFLHTVNVGDSGFMIFRENKMIFQSPKQQHRFNRPYQLGNNEDSDKPDLAEEFKVGVAAGDIVVFGTDGLWDNMFPIEIMRVMKREKIGEGRSVEPRALARIIAEAAWWESKNKWRISPFAEESLMAGKPYRGGKIDDITVVVAHIASC